MKLLWLLLPDEVLILVIAALALAVIVGLIRLRTALGIVGALALGIILTPFIEALFENLPPWVSLAVLIVFGLVICRAALELLIGKGASDHAVGGLAADALKGFFWFLFLPIRVLWWMLARVFAAR
jgi:hypothetical protein